MKVLLTHLLLFLSLSICAQTGNDTLSVYFDFNSSYLSKESKEQLADFRERIVKDDLIIEELKGYSDTLGSKEYNMYLSKKRVRKVLDQLSLNSDSSITWSGKGEVHPINSTKYSNQQKRRVDIIYSREIIIMEIVEAPKEKEVQPEIKEVENENSLTNDFVAFLKDTTVNEITIQLSILFMPGTDAFLYPNDPQLGELYNFLHYNERITAHIRGHVCCGNNLPLSHNRAMRVYNYLVKRSISPKRIDYQGYSNKIPFIEPEVTKEDQQKNRRVDVIFSKHITQ